MWRTQLGLYRVGEEWRAGIFGSTLVGKGKTKEKAITNARRRVKKIVRQNYPEGVIEIEIE